MGSRYKLPASRAYESHGPRPPLQKDSVKDTARDNVADKLRDQKAGKGSYRRRWQEEGMDDSDEDDASSGKEIQPLLQEEDIVNKHNEIIKTIDFIKRIDSDPNYSEDLGPDTKRNLQDYLTKESLQEYLLKPDGKTNSTLLHKLSFGYTLDNDKNRDFMARYLLKESLQLLHDKDAGERTPLSQAVENGAADFIASILQELQPADRVSALTQTAGGFTCLTLAIKRHMGTNYDVVKVLLHFSDPIVLITPDEKGNTPLHYLVQNPAFAPNSLMSFLKKLLEKGPGAMSITNNTEKETPYQARQRFLSTYDACCIVKISSAGPNGASKVKYRFKKPGDLGAVTVPDEVSELLKMHCMMNNFRIAEVLYKPGEEQHSVYLDLTSYHEQRIAYEKLSYMANPEFETILQFVRIPQICIDSPPSDFEPISENQQVRGIRVKSKRAPKQRRDVEYVFRWLKKQGVVKILEVEVTDFGGGQWAPGADCHSDEVIERALSPFKVIVWNWKRYDICSNTIVTAAPNVEKLYLYSKGNSAVLLGWSGEDGLKRLTELRSVHLIVHPELDSQERAERNIRNFEARMKKSNPEVQVNVKLDFSGSLGLWQSRSEEDAVQSSDRWIDTMRAWANYTLTFSPAPPPMSRQKPIVAILDDGVDVMRDDIKDRLIGGQSFKGTPGGQRYSGYQAGPGSHGTIMASLVLKMCPQATILPIRLDTRRSAKQGGAPCFTIRSAAEAVKWATLQEVDIISMSWSIEATADESRDELENLKSALGAAAAKNIILFCATSDKGNATADNLYPGCVPMILSIGAATSTGEVSAKVRSRKVQFIFPGEAVEIDRTNKADGSSIATALAAGTAAMLLHCADTVMPEDVHKEYHTHAAILRAFRKMGGTPESAPRVKEHFSYEDQKDWQQKLKDGEWLGSLRLKMFGAGILERSHYEDNNSTTKGNTRPYYSDASLLSK